MILSITMNNFRGVKSRTVEFGPHVNEIRGPNEIGKTTIDDAISFALYGCDRNGSANPDHLITFDSDTAEVQVQTDKATFIRRKKRGSTSQVKIVRDGYPDIKPTQTELTSLLGMTFDVFASCYRVGYFMTLTPQKKLAVISAIASFDRMAYLKEKLPGIQIPSYVKTVNLKVDADNVAKERRQTANIVAGDDGSLKELEIAIQSASIDGFDLTLAKQRLSQLDAELALHEQYQRELRQYQSDQTHNAQIEKRNSEIEAEKNKLKLQLQALGEKPVVSTLDIAKLESELYEYSTGPALLKPVPPTPLPKMDVGVSCTTCGQVVTEKYADKMRNQYEEALVFYNKAAREYEDAVIANNEKVKNLKSTILQKKQAHQAAVEAETKFIQNKQQIEFKLTQLVPSQHKVLIAPDKPLSDFEKVKQEHLELSAKKHAFEANKQRLEASLNRKKMIEESIVEKRNRVTALQSLEKVLLDLPNVEAKSTIDKLATPGVSVELGSDDVIVKDLRGVPHASLSAGKTIKVDLALAETITRNVASAPRFYFVDNSELADKLDLPKNAQVFLAIVDKTKTDLEVVQIGEL